MHMCKRRVSNMNKDLSKVEVLDELKIVEAEYELMGELEDVDAEEEERSWPDEDGIDNRHKRLTVDEAVRMSIAI